jgi:hypothetical protein
MFMHIPNLPFDIPQDVVDNVREVFAQCNEQIASTLCAMPNIHEPTLDQQLIAFLGRVPSRITPASRSIISVQTYFLGGPWYPEGWEIADIGVIIRIKDHGRLALTKTALLQSKRLFANGDKWDPQKELKQFSHGFGGLYLDDDELIPRRFEFTEQSKYLSLNLNGKQPIRIDLYQEEHGIPVFYMLYNPLVLPWASDVPMGDNGSPVHARNDVGCRILRSSQIHELRTSGLVIPSYFDVKGIQPPNAFAPFSAGWKLEDFVVDLMLACHEGYAAEAMDRTLRNVFTARNRPIAAAFSLTIMIGSEK